MPAIAWWPGKIAGGQVTGELTMGLDILPTVMDIAGITVPEDRKLDGASMKRLMVEGADFPDREIYFGYEPKLGTAMRDGRWKMIVSTKGVELYDLNMDVGERNNLVAAHPERAKKMEASIEEWKLDVGSSTSRGVSAGGR